MNSSNSTFPSLPRQPTDEDRRREKTLAAIVRRLGADPTPESVGARISEAVVDVVGAARWVSVSHRQDGTFTTVASTHLLGTRVDHAQFALGEGPCLSSTSGIAGIVQSVDLAADTRWPSFSELAPGLGVRSALSCRVDLRSTTAASLNVYSDRPHAFTRTDHRLCHLLAVAASLSLLALR